METEKKPEAKALERIQSKTFVSFEEADAARKSNKDPLVVKRKVFARHDGTFDLVLYGTRKEEKVEAKPAEQKPEEPKVHGLKAKDRRRRDRKAE